MKRIGFIDLQATALESGVSVGESPLSIYVFKNGSRGYEYESALKCTCESVSDKPAQLQGIDEFYLSIPLEFLDFRMLKLPFSDREKLERVIPFEIDSMMLDRAESIVFDFIMLGRSDDEFDILVVYMKNNMLRNILEVFSSRKMDPKVATSIELENMVSGDLRGVTEQIFSHVRLNDDDRVEAARDILAKHSVNLRKGLFAYTKDEERIWKKLKITSVLLLLLLTVINAMFAIRIMDSQKQASSVKSQMRAIYTDLFPDEKKITDELYQMKAHMKEIKSRAEVLIGIYPLDFMLNLSEKKAGVTFNEINLDKGLVTMKGESSSMDEISKLKTVISGFMADISITDIKPMGDGKTLFTVVARPSDG
jgi:type II secretory pathway component PulL